ncbi:MAG: sulfurtransferase [Formivibrio sp.]|nr:sulfurtransferase [Formivibrio sp.]
MNPLISVSELAGALHDADLVVVDCRHQLANPAWGQGVYAVGHIPGAVYMHLDEDMSGPMNGTNGRHPLPDPEKLAQKLGSLGIGNATRVVAYDDIASVPGAARLWWLLGWLGHDKVQVLDGGYAAWLAANQPGSTAVEQTTPVKFRANVQAKRVVDVDQVQANLDTKDFLVVDARGAERFRGIGETLDPVGGHIPQAANRFYQHNLSATGLFKFADELRDEWAQILGEWPVEKVVHQCGSGVTACHNLLALAHAGMNGGRLYAGSWSEWCADPARPVSRD